MTLFGNLYLAAVTALSVAGAVWLVVRLACPYGGGSEQTFG